MLETWRSVARLARALWVVGVTFCELLVMLLRARVQSLTRTDNHQK